MSCCKTISVQLLKDKNSTVIHIFQLNNNLLHLSPVYHSKTDTNTPFMHLFYDSSSCCVARNDQMSVGVNEGKNVYLKINQRRQKVWEYITVLSQFLTQLNN